MEAVISKSQEIDSRYATAFLLPVIALFVGSMSFGQWWWTIGLAVCFPVLLFKAESRLQTFLIAFCYHLGATHTLALSAARFYSDENFFGVAIWATGNLINGVIYAALWHRAENVRLFTIVIAIILTSLPPFGVLGWANPLTAAGVFFPGSGLLGFAYLLGLYVALAFKSKPFLKVFLVISAWCFFTAKQPKNSGWQAHNTRFGKTDDAGAGDYKRQKELISLAHASSSKVSVFPESLVNGGWTEVSESLWKKSLKTKRHVLIGAELLEFDDQHQKKYNALVDYDGKSTSIYKQRQPIPLSMWKPFLKSGYEANWFSTPILNVGGQKIAPLICYEGFLVWPVVHSYLAGAGRIVAVGNYWWTISDSIPSIHTSIMTSWSRLFSLPLTMAVNT